MFNYEDLFSCHSIGECFLETKGHWADSWLLLTSSFAFVKQEILKNMQHMSTFYVINMVLTASWTSLNFILACTFSSFDQWGNWCPNVTKRIWAKTMWSSLLTLVSPERKLLDNCPFHPYCFRSKTLNISLLGEKVRAILSLIFALSISWVCLLDFFPDAKSLMVSPLFISLPGDDFGTNMWFDSIS